MRAGEVIIQALSSFGYPVKPNRYDGSERKYFTYNYADERGSDFGDNEPGIILCNMQIHFFLPEYTESDGQRAKNSYTREKNQIREALFAAGFTYPEVTVLTETDNNSIHIIYECDITEEREEV